ncbi:MAG: glucose-6-phosphate dehydrogenase assembly protein OpcA [Leptolyngbyaceae cyanobacterium CSU_1_3]|nr:glucose-6-phosphate dehydrogenase assembly protein OpcA [Leptolyngbyaceae cyanobacterium CSU_1_3]
MPPKSAPVVPLQPLQSPKDVSLGEIEAELSSIWQSYSVSGDGSALAATRASTFTLIVYEPEETQQMLATLGFYTGPIDGIDGPRTEAAIRAAQSAYGLKVDGRATPTLLEKLRTALAKQKGQISSNGELEIDPRYTLDAEGSGIADAIASQNPCRIISLFPVTGEDEGVTAQVSAYCPINKQSRSALVCGEYITLKGTEPALDRISSTVSSLTISELPRFLWWKATPNLDQALFSYLYRLCNAVIVDSSLFKADPEGDLLKLSSLIADGVQIADLNWRRLAAWQELTAEAFDPPERWAAVQEVDRVVIDYEKGNPTQAMMFLGWLGSRLGWKPVSRDKQEDVYDLQRVYLVAADDRTIEVELAGIPTADSGEVAGDLVSIKLASTNPDADCCTVLCSQTMGCMRMEAKGGAQACRISQVTPLDDQKAETLLSEQLHRLGRDALYEESLAVAEKVLRLA